MSEHADKLKGAFAKAVSYKDKTFIIECSQDELETLMGDRVVQAALINAGYAIVPSEDSFAVSHKGESIGKLCGNDKSHDEK